MEAAAPGGYFVGMATSTIDLGAPFDRFSAGLLSRAVPSTNGPACSVVLIRAGFRGLAGAP